jgi:hypothetical protein
LNNRNVLNASPASYVLAKPYRKKVTPFWIVACLVAFLVANQSKEARTTGLPSNLARYAGRLRVYKDELIKL